MSQSFFGLLAVFHVLGNFTLQIGEFGVPIGFEKSEPFERGFKRFRLQFLPAFPAGGLAQDQSAFLQYRQMLVDGGPCDVEPLRNLRNGEVFRGRE